MNLSWVKSEKPYEVGTYITGIAFLISVYVSKNSIIFLSLGFFCLFLGFWFMVSKKIHIKEMPHKRIEDTIEAAFRPIPVASKIMFLSSSILFILATIFIVLEI